MVKRLPNTPALQDLFSRKFIMRKALIVEDNDNSRSMVIKALFQIDSALKVYEANNAEDAYYIAMNQSISLFVIDIILSKDVPGDVSGIIFADRLRKCDQYKYTPMIILTALEDPKLNAYSQLHCYSYLEKPINIEKMKEILKEALELPICRKKDEYVYFRKDGILHSIKKSDILYISVERRHTVIVCMNEKVEIGYKTCRQLLELLDSDDFIQCNRSTIVNRKYIRSVDAVSRYIMLKYSEQILEVGIIMKKSFLEKLQNGFD